MRFRTLNLYMRILLSTFLVIGTATASDEVSGLTLGKFNLGGYAFWQFGQMVKGDNFGKPINHQWTNGALLGFSITANLHERLRLVISPEFKINYPFPEEQNKPETVRPFGIAYINEADGIFTFGDLERPAVRLALGAFTYKYNPEAKHLGEYLFRTGTYPMYVLTDFDWPKARLIGLRASTDIVPNLHADLMLTSEAFMNPLYDFSLSGIASYKLFHAIDIGAGVDFARLIPVDPSKTSPKWTQFAIGSGCNQYITTDGDTAYYTFKGTKVMARTSIDPKAFFGSPAFFGKEDLKIYGEIMWLDPFGGPKAQDVKDTVNIIRFPDYYSDLSRRTILMFGFNIPAFRLLDILAIEFEYFPSMLPDDYYYVESLFSPAPRIESAYDYNPDDFKANAWKWSVYIKKEIIKGFSMTALFARDHLRTTYWNGARQTFTCMPSPGHWHWELKMGYNF